jgi:glycosyltransferase involved in cell wall biosynthesis
MRVVHLIGGLAVGGAELMLMRLLERSQRDGLAHAVIVLTRAGELRARLEAAGIEIIELGLEVGGSLRPAAGSRLLKALWQLRPAICQGWMYYGNMVALPAALLAPPPCRLLWGIHHSLHDVAQEKPLTRRLIQAGRPLSRLTSAIVYCSRTSARQHEAQGYAAARTVIIPNGFDCEVLRPRPEAKDRLCAELGLPTSTTLIGLLARHHPMKDHANLIRAGARCAAADLHLVLAGRGVDGDNEGLRATIAEAGMGGRVSLLGERHDVPELVAGLDVVAVSSAWGEAFPLVLGEAMASGVPCVATDIGDSAWIIADTGVVVPPRDPEALAGGLQHLVELGPEGRRRLGAAARARILDNFSLPEVVRQYETLYGRLVQGRPGRIRMAPQ